MLRAHHAIFKEPATRTATGYPSATAAMARQAAIRVVSDIFEGEHQWSPRKVTPFLKKWL
jgi:hypothetical protein